MNYVFFLSKSAICLVKYVSGSSTLVLYLLLGGFALDVLIYFVVLAVFL